MNYRSISVFLFAVLLAHGFAAPHRDDIESVVRKARAEAIITRSAPPDWLDFGRIRAAYLFIGLHRQQILPVEQTTTLAATYASKDLVPVLQATHHGTADFRHRMEATRSWLRAILKLPTSRDQFVTENFEKAVELGRFHQGLAEQVKAALAWDPRVRVPINQQSYAFVLYNIAWWPIEALVAQHRLDPAKDARGIDNWFHLWSVVGYAMGVEEELLPRDYARAREVVGLLRAAQYVGPGERVSPAVGRMLGAQVRVLAAGGWGGQNMTGTTEISEVAKRFGDFILLSPGMGMALGLGPDPAADLLRLAKSK